MEVSQRSLTNLRVIFADGSVDAKYAFPFWDAEWRVRFVLLDLFGAPGALIPAPVESGTMHEIRVAAARSVMRPLASEPADRFSGLRHYDTTWILRGSVGVREDLRHAILRTNLAGKAKQGSEKVHDIEFDERLAGVLWIVTQDRTFVTRRYQRGKLDLDDLR